LDDWIYWRLLLKSLLIIINYNSSQLRGNDCLRLSPFLTGLRVSSVPLWLTWLWFKNRSLLRMTSYLRMNHYWLSQLPVFPLFFKFLIGVQLGPLGTAATNRPIVPAWDDHDNGEIGGMNGRGNRRTRRKPAPVPLCPPQTPHAARTRNRAAAVGSQRLTAWATARPPPFITSGRTECRSLPPAGPLLVRAYPLLQKRVLIP
jgi:hypothetical protein